MTITNLTKFQIEALIGLICTTSNGDSPEHDLDDNCSWFSPKDLREGCGWTAQQVSGVITGLLEIGAIVNYDVNLYFVAKDTYEAFIAHYGEGVEYDEILDDLRSRI